MKDKLIQFKGTIYEEGYGIVAKKVMTDNKLSLGAKCLYSYLCTFTNFESKSAFPGRDKICFDLNISKDTFGKYKKQLENQGYLTVIQKKDYKSKKFAHNVYSIESIPCPKNPDTENPDTKNPDTENLDTNNTSINNTNINNTSIEEIWSMYPLKKGKARAIKKIPKIIEIYGKEQIQRCITRYINYVNARRKNDFPGLRFQNGDTFFNGTYIDYLDNNYKESGGVNNGKSEQNTKQNKAKQEYAGEKLAKRALEKYGDKLEDFECDF